MLGKMEGKRRRGRQRTRRLDSIPDSTDMSLSAPREVVKDREAWHAAAHGVAESDMTKRLNNRCVNRIVSFLLKKKSPLIYHKIMHVWRLFFRKHS